MCTRSHGGSATRGRDCIPTMKKYKLVEIESDFRHGDAWLKMLNPKILGRASQIYKAISDKIELQQDLTVVYREEGLQGSSIITLLNQCLLPPGDSIVADLPRFTELIRSAGLARLVK